MEHPDVIREIDALIDSYNWEGLVTEPDRFVKSIKRFFQLQKPWIYLRPVNQEGEFIVLQLMLHFLHYPKIKHKGWIFEVVSGLCHTSLEERSSPFWIQKVRLVQNILPLLQRYITSGASLWF